MRAGVVAALAACAIPLAGCGGDEDKDDPSVPAGVAAQHETIEEEVKAEGGEKRVGPWRVAYIVEPAEGWFERRGGDFEWRAPRSAETHHIEILPIEAATGRLVPNVPITVEGLDGAGKRVAR